MGRDGGRGAVGELVGDQGVGVVEVALGPVVDPVAVRVGQVGTGADLEFRQVAEAVAVGVAVLAVARVDQAVVGGIEAVGRLPGVGQEVRVQVGPAQGVDVAGLAGGEMDGRGPLRREPVEVAGSRPGGAGPLVADAGQQPLAEPVGVGGWRVGGRGRQGR